MAVLSPERDAKRQMETQKRIDPLGSVEVVNLLSGDSKIYAGLTPREAVIAAHAQERGDWATWDYRKKYDARVRMGHKTVACGDWTAMR